MARIRIGGTPSDTGTFVKWSDTPPGTVYTGTWQGTRPGRFGDLGDLDTADGIITFPLPHVLAQLLEEVAIGDAIELIYVGKKTSEKSDRQYHDFELYQVVDDVPF
jgi:hypothetical protein